MRFVGRIGVVRTCDDGVGVEEVESGVGYGGDVGTDVATEGTELVLGREGGIQDDPEFEEEGAWGRGKREVEWSEGIDRCTRLGAHG